MAPTTPVRQTLVASSLGLEWQVVGAISETKFIVANDGTGEFEVWSADATGVTLEDSAAVTFSYGQFNSMQGKVAYFTPGSGLWHFFSDGAPWTTDLSVNLTVLATERLYVAGDQSEAVGSDGTDVFGVPMDGTTTANWTCSLGTGVLVGAPRQDRWLRMVGDFTTDGMTVELMDETGTSLDSVTFTAPPDSWHWNSGDDDEQDSLIWWVQVAENVNTYLGVTKPDAPDYTITLHHRTLVTTGDTLAWHAAEATIDPQWTRSTGGLQHLHPYATAWDGQLAIGYLRDEFS